MIAAMLDHLWQSTLFAGAAGLVTLLLQRNAARARFWLWFTASVKFLVPFAALSALGAALLPKPGAPVLARFVPMAEPVLAPAANTHALAAIASHPVMAAITAHPVMAAPPDWSAILFILWALGTLAVAVHWLSRWMKLRVVLAQACDTVICGVAVRTAPAALEPGLFGIFKPAIVLPQGIEQELSGAEIGAVLAHETCHRDHRDNLWAAVHMLVEALFWFHPLVWWLGARLNHERERACDEAVLARGQAADVYAESILKVCKLYVHSPLACVAGVSGANLKERLERIVVENVVLPLSAARKALLAGLGAGTLILPLALGLLTVPPATVAAVAHVAAQVLASTVPVNAATPVAVPAQDVAAKDSQPEKPVAPSPDLQGSAAPQPSAKLVAANDAPVPPAPPAPPAVAQAAAQPASTPEHIAELRAEQAMPRTAVPFDPADFDKFVGEYQLGPTTVAWVMRDGSHYLSRLTGQVAIEFFPESQTKFFSTEVRAQISFGVDASGQVTEMVLHQNGREQHAPRISLDAAKAAEDALMARIKTNQPSPGTEAAIRHQIEAGETGVYDYDAMTPELAAIARSQEAAVSQMFAQLGAFKSITFKNVGPGGADVYDVAFERGHLTWTMATLTADGKIRGMLERMAQP
jgi:beta-lactamase regulating signal transducer with metallopeptidase domain